MDRKRRAERQTAIKTLLSYHHRSARAAKRVLELSSHFLVLEMDGNETIPVPAGGLRSQRLMEMSVGFSKANCANSQLDQAPFEGS